MMKEETKLLSDDDFERIGRKKKIAMYIIVAAAILALGLATFIYFSGKKDSSINAQMSAENEKVEKEAVDETAGKEILSTDIKSGEGEAGILPFARNTLAGENESICEYSQIYLPELLMAGDYVDVRLSLADGRNYTVAAAKRVADFTRAEEKSFVYLALCEEEIIILESAIADLKLFDGARLYLVINKEEDANEINYPVNKKADKLLHVKKGVNNLSGYEYKVKFDKGLEKERLMLKKAKGLKGQEWKEAASYWNEKE